MQVPLALYLASVAGAISLYLAMPKYRLHWPVLATILGASTIGVLWIYLHNVLNIHSDIHFYYVFSAIAIFATVKVITHQRPVYSALWFVLVVLASAGLLLMLQASFVALAMVIIYAGAIIVTYVFVIMLAHSVEPQIEGRKPLEYDFISWEPLLAVCSGFLLLAVLLNVAFEYMAPNDQAAGIDSRIVEQILPKRIPGLLAGPDDTLTDVAKPANIEYVGVDLFKSHPLGLELAGVILLVALIGAITLSRVEVSENKSDIPGS